MAVNVTIKFDQVIKSLNLFSSKELISIKDELDKLVKKREKKRTHLKNLLLKGPILDDKQIKLIEMARDDFDKWRD
ncbi:MAG: hypothetical protein AAF519_08995 [Bacteroidota bacterium]